MAGSRAGPLARPAGGHQRGEGRRVEEERMALLGRDPFTKTSDYESRLLGRPSFAHGPWGSRLLARGPDSCFSSDAHLAWPMTPLQPLSWPCPRVAAGNTSAASRASTCPHPAASTWRSSMRMRVPVACLLARSTPSSRLSPMQTGKSSFSRLSASPSHSLVLAHSQSPSLTPSSPTTDGQEGSPAMGQPQTRARSIPQPATLPRPPP